MAIAGEQKTVTRFQNTDGEIIASSEWRMGAEEDVISILGHASALSFNAFFKKAFLPFNLSMSESLEILCSGTLRLKCIRSARSFLGPGGTKFHWKQIESGLHVGVSHIRVIITCINTVFSCIKRGLDERVQLQSIPNLEGS